MATELISSGIKLGLVGGSHWQSIHDEPHFQLAGLPITPTEEMREYLSANGLKVFWEKLVPTHNIP